jgi:hypothetical protein
MPGKTKRCSKRRHKNKKEAGVGVAAQLSDPYNNRRQKLRHATFIIPAAAITAARQTSINFY